MAVTGTFASIFFLLRQNLALKMQIHQEITAVLKPIKTVHSCHSFRWPERVEIFIVEMNTFCAFPLLIADQVLLVCFEWKTLFSIYAVKEWDTTGDVHEQWNLGFFLINKRDKWAN